jgi:hypothetical protein
VTKQSRMPFQPATKRNSVDHIFFCGRCNESLEPLNWLTSSEDPRLDPSETLSLVSISRDIPCPVHQSIDQSPLLSINHPSITIICDHPSSIIHHPSSAQAKKHPETPKTMITHQSVGGN